MEVILKELIFICFDRRTQSVTTTSKQWNWWNSFGSNWGIISFINNFLFSFFLKIDDMEREINKALPNSRASLTGKLKQYKRGIEIIEKELVKSWVNDSF